MLGRDAIERYRQMTPSQRPALTIQATRESWPYLFHGPPDVVDRRLELIRRENDARNRALLEGPAKA